MSELSAEFHHRQRQSGIVRAQNPLLDRQRLAIGALGVNRIADVVVCVSEAQLLEEAARDRRCRTARRRFAGRSGAALPSCRGRICRQASARQRRDGALQRRQCRPHRVGHKNPAARRRWRAPDEASHRPAAYIPSARRETSPEWWFAPERRRRNADRSWCAILPKRRSRQAAPVRPPNSARRRARSAAPNRRNRSPPRGRPTRPDNGRARQLRWCRPAPRQRRRARTGRIDERLRRRALAAGGEHCEQQGCER